MIYPYHTSDLSLRGAISAALLVEPLLAPSIDPFTLPLDPVLVQVVANSALFTTEPATLVLSAILPDEAALAMALVLLELTLILLAIRPDKVSKAMHFIVEPLA